MALALATEHFDERTIDMSSEIKDTEASISGVKSIVSARAKVGWCIFSAMQSYPTLDFGHPND